MSRSIHTTYRDITDILQHDYADPAEKRTTLRRLQTQYRKKRNIKWLIIKGRREVAALPSPVSPDTIPIICRDASPFINYPASIEDIRAVLKLLPPGLLIGLTEIELCLGASFQLPYVKEDTTYDPLTRRASYQNLPGIYNGLVLGTYTFHFAKIRLFAYVYDRLILTDPDMWELLFRLCILSTLMHEISHHFDYTVRVARGRWRADQTEAQEIFARKQEYDWLQTYVIPYLEQTYPLELERLNNWMQEKAGIILPLVILSGDPRTLAKGNRFTTAGLWGTTSAIEGFITSAIKNTDINKARYYLAKNFHRNDKNPIAKVILDVILKEQPENLEALVQQATVLTELGDYQAADALLDKVFSLDESYVDAWMQLVELAKIKQNWFSLVTAANQGVESGADGWKLQRLIQERGLALIELGRFEEAQADIDFLLSLKQRWSNKLALSIQDRLQILKPSLEV